MSANGQNHDRGTCDNCGAVGKLGYVVGRPDRSHKHACSKQECVDALETNKVAPAPRKRRAAK